MRLSDFTTFTRQRTLDAPTSKAADVERAALALLEVEVSPVRKFRLVGVGVSGLEFGESATQLSLFDSDGQAAADFA